MHRFVHVVIAVLIVITSFLAALTPEPLVVNAAPGDEPCQEDKEGDYRTRFPNSGGARFIWRGGKIEATVTFLPLRCSASTR